MAYIPYLSKGDGVARLRGSDLTNTGTVVSVCNNVARIKWTVQKPFFERVGICLAACCRVFGFMTVGLMASAVNKSNTVYNGNMGGVVTEVCIGICIFAAAGVYFTVARVDFEDSYITG